MNIQVTSSLQSYLPHVNLTKIKHQLLSYYLLDVSIFTRRSRGFTACHYRYVVIKMITSQVHKELLAMNDLCVGCGCRVQTQERGLMFAK